MIIHANTEHLLTRHFIQTEGHLANEDPCICCSHRQLVGSVFGLIPVYKKQVRHRDGKIYNVYLGRNRRLRTNGIPVELVIHALVGVRNSGWEVSATLRRQMTVTLRTPMLISNRTDNKTGCWFGQKTIRCWLYANDSVEIRSS